MSYSSNSQNLALINKKRERSKSHSPCSKRSRKREVPVDEEYLIGNTVNVDHAKIECDSCNKNLLNSIRTITKTQKNCCIDCLCLGKVKEDYHVVDKLDFPVFHDDWTFKEELLLLTGIEKFGLDNWGDISNFVRTKPKLLCEAHFYTFFCKSPTSPLPEHNQFIFNKSSNEFNIIKERNTRNQQAELDKKKELSDNQGKIPEMHINKENKLNRSRSLVKNRNRKDQKNITSVEEIVGYWPRREEFDIEFLNEAELEIAELEFLDEDTPEEHELKLNVLKVYNMQLNEREKRKR